jgi:hypothetical protein
MQSAFSKAITWEKANKRKLKIIRVTLILGRKPTGKRVKFTFKLSRFVSKASNTRMNAISSSLSRPGSQYYKFPETRSLATIVGNMVCSFILIYATTIVNILTVLSETK